MLKLATVLFCCVLCGAACAPTPATSLSSDTVPPVSTVQPTVETVLTPEYGATPGGEWPTAQPGDPGYLDTSRLPFVDQASLPICDFSNPTPGPTAAAVRQADMYATPACRPAGEGINTAP